MKLLLIVILGLAALVSTTEAQGSDKKIVCYYGSWATYRPGRGKADVEDLDPTLCTHMIYTFVGITESGGIRSLDPWCDLPDEYGMDGFGRFQKLKLKNPHMKTILAIGGWNEGSTKYSKVANNPSLRSAFVNNAVTFLKKYKFDGLDLDWEYPSQRGGLESDKHAYSLWVKEIRERFDKEGLLLTAAVACAEFSASQSYEIAEMSKHLHFINVMAYDMHGKWDNVTGYNAPMYPRTDEVGSNRKLNVNETIHYWLSQGAPKEKIILGMPLYGRSFKLFKDNETTPGSPTNPYNPDAAMAGPYTRENGFIGYNEICEYYQTAEWKQTWDEESLVPYTVRGLDWLAYDNIESIKIKTEFINKLGLGGAMVWSIETDDFRGVCGPKYPLLNTIKSTLGVEFPEITTIKTTEGTGSTTTSKPTVPTTTTQKPPQRDCKEAGYFRDPKDCAAYYQCVQMNNSFISYEFRCGENEYFDEKRKICDFKENVECNV